MECSRLSVDEMRDCGSVKCLISSSTVLDVCVLRGGHSLSSLECRFKVDHVYHYSWQPTSLDLKQRSKHTYALRARSPMAAPLSRCVCAQCTGTTSSFVIWQQICIHSHETHNKHGEYLFLFFLVSQYTHTLLDEILNDCAPCDTPRDSAILFKLHLNRYIPCRDLHTLMHDVISALGWFENQLYCCCHTFLALNGVCLFAVFLFSHTFMNRFFIALAWAPKSIPKNAFEF